MNRRFLLRLTAGVLVAMVVLGWLSWFLTGSVQRFLLSDKPRHLGWTCSTERARWVPSRWVPWSHLELNQIQIQVYGRGKLHLVKANIFPQWASLIRNELCTEWELGEIRMDPASWGIRKPLAQELLSAGPVTTHGSARLRCKQEEFLLERFSLEGPVLRVQAEGWMRTKRQEAHLALKGFLSRPVLEGMSLLSPEAGSPAWESFEMHLEGRLKAPAFRFNSSFLTFAVNQPMEKKP